MARIVKGTIDMLLIANGNEEHMVPVKIPYCVVVTDGYLVSSEYKVLVDLLDRRITETISGTVRDMVLAAQRERVGIERLITEDVHHKLMKERQPSPA